jgi:hypothetical protein
MAEQTGVSRAQLHRFERELVDRGFLIVVNRATAAGGKASNLYDFSPLLQQLEHYITEDHARESEEKAALSKLVRGYVAPADIGYVTPADHGGITGGPHEEAISRNNSGVDNSIRRAPPTTFESYDEELSTSGTEDTENLISSADATDHDTEQVIRNVVGDLRIELGDRAGRAATEARAVNLFRAAGLDQATFVACIYDARRTTQQRRASIHASTETRSGRKTKAGIPYFFEVLADLLRQRGADIPE